MVLSIAWSVLSGLAIFVVAMTAFIVLQHKGLFGISAVLAGAALRGDRAAEAAGHASRVDDAVREIYRDRRRLWRASLWRLAGWIAGMGEIWLTMVCLGQPIGLADALILESLSSGVRAAAFMVPGAMGALEGGFVLLGAALGLSPATALAISLTKRVRELGLGLPGLLAWHLAEARRAGRPEPAAKAASE
jgi:putative membrane protein